LKEYNVDFCGFLVFLLGIPHLPHEYSPISEHLELHTLVDRRTALGNKFIKNVLDGKVDSPSLLSLIKFKVPKRQSRYHAPLYIPFCTTNYLSK